MENSVYISVGIPFYNAESYLESAICSVIVQTHKFWELILIDDGSSDGSLEIANKYSKMDNRIRVISDGKNKKLPTRLNQLIAESQGQYIARMDADDIMHPERLEKQLKFLEDNLQYDLVSTGIVTINNNNQAYGYRGIKHLYTDFENIEKSYPIIHPSIFARKEWYTRNNYNISYPRSEDYELWCNAISKKDLKLAVLPELLYYYREEGNLSSEKLVRTYQDVFKTYCKYQGGYKVSEFIKMTAKSNIIIVLDKIGLLQTIAKIRNKEVMTEDSKSYHQSIINNIINSI